MKSITLILCVIALLGSAASGYFYMQIGSTRDQLQLKINQAESRSTELQTKLAEAGAQGEVLQKRLAELDADLGDAKSKVSAAEGRNTQLGRDVQQLRNQLTAKNDAEQTLNREISQLKRELAQSKLAASAASPEEVDGYKATIATLQARINELAAGRPSSTAVRGGPSEAVTGASNSAGADAGASFEVVSIGEKNGFVVINGGSAKNVVSGQKLTISRDGKTVAETVVSSVQDSYAIAQVVTGSLRGGLLKGDVATITQ